MGAAHKRTAVIKKRELRLLTKLQGKPQTGSPDKSSLLDFFFSVLTTTKGFVGESVSVFARWPCGGVLRPGGGLRDKTDDSLTKDPLSHRRCYGA